MKQTLYHIFVPPAMAPDDAWPAQRLGRRPNGDSLQLHATLAFNSGGDETGKAQGTQDYLTTRSLRTDWTPGTPNATDSARLLVSALLTKPLS